MKVVIIFILALTSSLADDDGKYRPDDSGKYVHNPNDGRYFPDDSGRYIPDFSGAYYYDGSGFYKADGSGGYKFDDGGKYKPGKAGFYSADGKFLGNGSNDKYKSGLLTLQKTGNGKNSVYRLTANNASNRGSSKLNRPSAFNLDGRLSSDFNYNKNSASLSTNTQDGISNQRSDTGDYQNNPGQQSIFEKNLGGFNSGSNIGNRNRFGQNNGQSNTAGNVVLHAGSHTKSGQLPPQKHLNDDDTFANSGLFTASDKFSSSSNLIGAGTNDDVRKYHPGRVYAFQNLGGTTPSVYSGASTNNAPVNRVFKPSSAKGTTYGQGRYADGFWKILKQDSNVDEDGYHWEYETENGIVAEETGRLANKGSDQEAMRAFGSYQYTGPDNVVYSVKYTADERGFIPEGSHLPTPPPIPDAILRSLEFLRSSGKLN